MTLRLHAYNPAADLRDRAVRAIAVIGAEVASERPEAVDLSGLPVRNNATRSVPDRGDAPGGTRRSVRMNRAEYQRAYRERRAHERARRG